MEEGYVYCLPLLHCIQCIGILVSTLWLPSNLLSLSDEQKTLHLRDLRLLRLYPTKCLFKFFIGFPQWCGSWAEALRIVCLKLYNA